MGEPRYVDANRRMVGLVYACNWAAACYVDRCGWEASGNEPTGLDQQLAAHLARAHPGRVTERITIEEAFRG